MARALRGHRAALELPRQADREVADVDHLLDLTERFGRDLPGLDRDQLSDLGLVLCRSAPRRLTSAPRTGAGTVRQLVNAALAAAIAVSTSARPAAGTSNSASPVIGERALTRGPSVDGSSSTPQRSRLCLARPAAAR